MCLHIHLSILPFWSDRHGRRRPSFGRFCAFKVTCCREPISLRSPNCDHQRAYCSRPPGDIRVWRNLVELHWHEKT
jgi:hypothetical protein